MKSPFPGMDPYLESHWEDVHQTLIVYTRDALQPQLPPDLRARVEERVYLQAGLETVRPVVPDVHLAQLYPGFPPKPDTLRDSGAALAEPLVFELNNPPITESYLTIREKGGGKVITVIEFLSPANKRNGTGQQKYLEKQNEILASDTSLVEIDLVRAGERVLALPNDDIPAAYRADYLACISPGWKRNRRELYRMPLRQTVPRLPIPLRPHEPPVTLDLQALIDQAYAAGRYDDLNYAAPLDPPLSPQDSAWVNDLIKTTEH